MSLLEASAIWVDFKETLKFICKSELHLDMTTEQCEELLSAILLLEDHYIEGGKSYD